MTLLAQRRCPWKTGWALEVKRLRKKRWRRKVKRRRGKGQRRGSFEKASCCTRPPCQKEALAQVENHQCQKTRKVLHNRLPQGWNQNEAHCGSEQKKVWKLPRDYYLAARQAPRGTPNQRRSSEAQRWDLLKAKLGAGWLSLPKGWHGVDGTYPCEKGIAYLMQQLSLSKG